MWAYGVEICFSPLASKNFYSVLPHMTSKGRYHGSIVGNHSKGYRAWFQQLNIFVRVGTRGYIVLSIPKGRG